MGTKMEPSYANLFVGQTRALGNLRLSLLFSTVWRIYVIGWPMINYFSMTIMIGIKQQLAKINIDHILIGDSVIASRTNDVTKIETPHLTQTNKPL